MSALTEAEEERWLVDRERGGWQYATERIVAAREAAAREAVLEEVEALAERMLACIGCYDEAIQECPRHGEEAARFYIPQAADQMFALARRLREGGPDA